MSQIKSKRKRGIPENILWISRYVYAYREFTLYILHVNFKFAVSLGLN